MISKVFSLYKMDALGHSLLDDAHNLQLFMSAEKSASAVVLPINTKKIGKFFQFFQKW
jgi:hypothetical protein